jgi:fused signal recognition particle receptor
MTSILDKWKDSLVKTRDVSFGKIATLFGASQITDETWDELEALLLQADIGMPTTQAVIADVRKHVSASGVIKSEDYQQILRNCLKDRLMEPSPLIMDHQPTVVLVVGVNGSGKTTTIAKLGAQYREQGKQIMFGAADTFRAAAVDQLKVWGDRLHIPVISGQDNADPGAVAFDAVQAAIAKKSDILFIDTAGRLHTRFNLMEELKKVHRVVSKALPGSPHAVWIVLDATTGQNAFQQARMFKEAVQVDGVILTKLDSSAKGGMAFAIQKELGLPILYAGLGEKVEDLQVFSPEKFVDGILKF